MNSNGVPNEYNACSGTSETMCSIAIRDLLESYQLREADPIVVTVTATNAFGQSTPSMIVNSIVKKV